MKNHSLLLCTALLTTLSVAAVQAQTYQLVWADEFKGTTVNTANWAFETGNSNGWGNNEKQYYQAANATVANDVLMITAKRENVGGMLYTSARMKTQGLKSFKYGRIEARIKMPLGQGLWPAFWMLGNPGQWPACGEIDIMEHVNADNVLHATEHWDSNGHAQYGTTTTIATPGDYHVYSVEWDANYIRTFVDGAKFHEFTITNGAGGTEEFQQPFYLLLNLAVAGDMPGQTVDTSKLPATMYVDYVRVSQQVAAPSSITWQAEAASTNSGMVAETCSEGGQDMGYIDAGDFLVFNSVNFPSTGTYNIEYRVASGAAGGTISADLNAGSIQLGSTTIPGTGGWQTWTTVSKTVNVNAGTYNFGVFAQTGGYNLNWVRITKTGAKGTLASAGGASKESITLYPNPVVNRLTLTGGTELVGGPMSIMGVDGRQVWRGIYSGESVDLSALKPGIYTLLAHTKNGQKLVHRFNKQ